MDKHPIVHVGGDMESALNGKYTINIQSILKEAWALTLLSRKTINISLFFILMFGVFITLLTSNFLGGIEKVQQDPEASFLINIIITLVISPLIAGVEMFGVFASVGIKSQPRMLFSFLKSASYVSLCALCSMVLISIGLELFVLPGVYLVIALTLTMPLIIEKKLSPLKSILISLKVTRFQWPQIFLLHFILATVFFVSLLPLLFLINSPASIIGVAIFFFSMSYLAPMYYHMKGILYREIFGLDIQTVDKQTTINSTFSA